MKKFEVNGHEPSILPDGDWKLVWCDEFDGKELDTSKWEYRTHIWGERHPCFAESGVELDGNSNAVFKIFEKDGEICSPHLQTGSNWIDSPRTNDDVANKVKNEDNSGLQWPIGKLKEPKFTHRYGYYECRCKLQKYAGWWSAFWLQSQIIGSSLDSGLSGIEVDIMESFKPGEVSVHVLHYDGYGEDHKSRIIGEDKSGMSLDEYHRFGVLWEPDGYTFFVDGVQDGEKAESPVSHIPQFILISTEVNGYRTSAHAPTEEAKIAAKLGDEFVVDYVRVFDRVEQQK